ncbi:hypothetical protein [Spirobacillus cienkowskii]|uniref:hypothetical protein n=1 Tax=Spirobacillus cienkowskii TaxID=495820 RepID=UPI0030D2B1D6
MKKEFHYCFVTMILILIFSVQGCIGLTHHNIILERSQKALPDWLQQNQNIEFYDKQFVYLIYKKTNVYNLNLGIKQAQAAAMLQTRLLVMDKIEKTLSKKLSPSSLSTYKEQDSLFNELALAVDRNRSSLKIQPALPREVYWEYHERDADNGSERFYVIWVLLTVPKVDYESALTTTALSLTKSSYSDIVDLGQSILQQKNSR